MSIQNIYNFLKQPIKFQVQSFFEFRYEKLFKNDSFLIEQLNFPKVDSNVGYIYLDGYQIPVHSTAKFENEISFMMYAEESDFSQKGGKYFDIVESILVNNHAHYFDTEQQSIHTPYLLNKPAIAEIIPLSSDYGKPIEFDSDKKITLYNAMIKSISLSGGFTANSTTLVKYDVSMTYSHIDYPMRKHKL